MCEKRGKTYRSDHIQYDIHVWYFPAQTGIHVDTKEPYGSRAY